MVETADITATEKSYTAMRERNSDGKKEEVDIATTKKSNNTTVETSITVKPGTFNAVTTEKSDILKADTDISKQFAGIPIEHLISDPIIAVAKGQAALCNVYLDNIYKLAYKNGKPVEKAEDNITNTVSFKLERPVTYSPDKPDAPKTESVTVTAPLISLVPVPAFIMEEVTVHFTMEVKEQTTDTSSVDANATLEVGGSHWGFTAKITGSVTTNSSHTRTSNQTATYDISARAIQQPPAEGMAKLTSLFASTIEPIPFKTGT